ncbi:ComEC/Rec2 family competence protein [Microbacterium sp. CJ88]|uniref:ComEC/Rec2 family competence protein n=1 Tax=Microbacterium sp. CJ88 TaxID=3445672 RepID=UPI003F658D0B
MNRLRRRLRLVPVAGVAWIAAGWTTAVPDSAAAVAAVMWVATTVGVFALLVPKLRAHRTTRICVVLGVISLSLGAATASTVALAQPARQAAAQLPTGGGRALTVDATVVGKVEPWGSDRLAFDAIADAITIGPDRHPVAVPITVLLPRTDGAPGLDIGAAVEVDGTAAPADPGARAVLEVIAARSVTVVREPLGLLAATSALRHGLVASASGLPEPGAGLLPGLAVGDTSAVADELDADMKASSLSHLTAVSGANCALVVGLAFGAAALCGAGRAHRVVSGVAALAGFVVLVSPEPSVVRAAVMAAAAMLAVLLGRTGAGIAIVALAVAVILVVDPWLAGSLGFALSTVATASLLLFARPLASGLARWMPHPLALALSVPLAAQLACGPLIVLITPVTPLYGVVANLLAAPAAPVATVVGLAACLALPLPLLQSGLAVIAWLPAAWIAGTATTFAALPGNAVPWLDGWAGVATLAGLGLALGLVIVGVGAHARAWRRRLHGSAAFVVATVVGVSTGSAALGSVAAPFTVPSAWAVAACDIGQGDAVLVRSEGHVALIDTGPDPALLESCLIRFGLTRIDLLVLTHFDVDHAGGAQAVLGRVATVLHGPPGDVSDTGLLQRLETSGATVHSASTGMTGTLGGARWRVLWPREGSKAFPPGNDSGVVVDLRGGSVPSSVYLADLSGAAQRSLLATGELRPPYDVVKVAHHGSADQHPALYAQLGASVAIVPVGAGNRYGHPRSETLAFLGDAGMSIARTDTDGVVAVWQVDGMLSVWRERAVAPVARAPPTGVVGGAR